MLGQEQQPDIISRQALMAEKLGLYEFLPQSCQSIHAIYEELGNFIDTISPEIIASNHVTLTMVKPRIHRDIDHNQLDLSLFTGTPTLDEELLAHHLLSLLTRELTPLVAFSLNLTTLEIDMFYHDAIERMASNPAYNAHPEDRFTNGASEFISWFQSGPVTYSVLYDPSPQTGYGAVEKLISVNGRGLHRSWDVEDIKAHFPTAVRSLARGNHNNLTHASASITDVAKELTVLSTILHSRCG